MRELTRCIAWALFLGALALGLAMAVNLGVAQSEGVKATLILVVFAPFYAMTGAAPGTWGEDPLLAGTTIAAQFLYFLAIVAAVRFAWRRRRR